jgi:hypothetical protein
MHFAEDYFTCVNCRVFYVFVDGIVRLGPVVRAGSFVAFLFPVATK